MTRTSIKGALCAIVILGLAGCADHASTKRLAAADATAASTDSTIHVADSYAPGSMPGGLAAWMVTVLIFAMIAAQE